MGTVYHPHVICVNLSFPLIDVRFVSLDCKSNIRIKEKIIYYHNNSISYLEYFLEYFSCILKLSFLSRLRFFLYVCTYNFYVQPWSMALVDSRGIYSNYSLETLEYTS